jgi:hypothetical protein
MVQRKNDDDLRHSNPWKSPEKNEPEEQKEQISYGVLLIFVWIAIVTTQMLNVLLRML